MDADEPIKLHDKRFVLPEGDSFGAHQLTYRTGDTVAPYVSAEEPLANQLHHFIDCIRGARVPLGRMVRRRRRRGARGGRPLVPRRRRARRGRLPGAGAGSRVTRVVLCVQNMGVPDDPRVWNEATSLAAAGYDVTVVAPRTGGDRAGRADRRRRRRALPEPRRAAGDRSDSCSRSPAGFVGTARRVARLRRSGPIDVLHVANPPDTLFPLAWWLRRSGTRFVFDQHDATPELARRQARAPPGARPRPATARAAHRTPPPTSSSSATTRSPPAPIDRGGARAERVVTVRLGPRAAAAAPATPPASRRSVVRRRDGQPGHRRGAHRRLRHGAAAPSRRRPARARSGAATRSPTLRAASTEHGIDDAVTWTGLAARAEMRRAAGRGHRRRLAGRRRPVHAGSRTMIKVSEYLAPGLPAVVADLPENRATAGDARRLLPPRRRRRPRRPPRARCCSTRRPSRRDGGGRPRAGRRRCSGSTARRGCWPPTATSSTARPAVEGDQHVDDALVATGS